VATYGAGGCRCAVLFTSASQCRSIQIPLIQAAFAVSLRCRAATPFAETLKPALLRLSRECLSCYQFFHAKVAVFLALFSMARQRC